MKKLMFSLFTSVLIIFSFNALADSSDAMSFKAPEMIKVLECLGCIPSGALSLAEDTEDSFSPINEKPTNEGFIETRLSSASDYGAKVSTCFNAIEPATYGGAAKALLRQLHPT